MPSTDRRRPPARLVLALAAAALSLLVLPAHAAAPDPAIAHQAWASTGQPPQVSTEQDAIYASALVGRERARSYLQLSVSTVPPAELQSSSLVLVPAGAPVLDRPSPLIACLLTEPLNKDGDITSDKQPATDCGVQTSLVMKDGNWLLPLEVFAPFTRSGTLGVSVQPDLDVGTSFEIAFDTTKTSLQRPSTGGGQATGDAPAARGGDQQGATRAGSSGSGFPSNDGAGLISATSPTIPLGQPADTPAGGVPMAAFTSPAASAESSARVATVAAPGRPASTSGLPAALAGAAVFGVGLLLRRRIATAAGALTSQNRASSSSALLATGGATFLGLTIIGSLGGEAFAFKIGIVAIVFVGAVGLHILVNGAGELSLAHAAVIGLPAFVVAQVSSHGSVSPIYLLPLGVALGTVLGALVGLPALRSRGLQVALVTLAAAFAIERYLFRQSWIIGPPSGLVIPEPSFLGMSFSSNRALLPVLALVVAFTVVVAKALLQSRLGRAFAFVRSSPDAAAAVGIPIALYRLVAFAVAGAFAGGAGSLYVVWVQRVSAPTFSITQSFFYLVVVVLAGRGGLGGLALSTVLLSGGQLFLADLGTFFDYAGPITLIANLALYRKGLNGALTELSQRWASRSPRPARGSAMTEERPTVRVAVPSITLVAGYALVAAGFIAIGLAWYHSGNTNSSFVQNQELISGGIGGLALIIFGATMLLRDAFMHGRTVTPTVALERSSRPIDAGQVSVPDDLSALEEVPGEVPVPRRARGRSASKA